MKTTQLLIHAKTLRSQMTPSEKILWYNLRAGRFFNYKFRRQAPIEKYIVDFVCFSSDLIIEVDGGQHSENEDYDEERTNFLRKKGFRVIRFWNNEVLKNIDIVLEAILKTLLEYPSPSVSTPRPLPQGAR
ncbi:MAG: endonuclease domain-containing protein [Gammaproteobacteria bacterium]|nr:endonuclease domain-containing protein [Gammaproteobacteria bacterium]